MGREGCEWEGWPKAVPSNEATELLSRETTARGEPQETAGSVEISSSGLGEGIAIGDIDLTCLGSQYSTAHSLASVTHDFESEKTDEWRWFDTAQRGYDDSAHKTGSNDRVEAENAVGWESVPSCSEIYTDRIILRIVRA